MKKWYLLTDSSRPNEIGGYENDSFVDYKGDAFQESLTTDIADTVILYNYDLSKHKQIRGIIQNNVADTQLKSLERTILVPIGTLKAGMYVYFEDCYWLVTGYPGNNHVYEKATLSLCQHKLKWQLRNGMIIERWANFVSASKYDTGRSGNEIILLPSNNFTVLIPDDDLSATLDDKRVFIDRDVANPSKVFRITRSDDVLYLYQDHGGVLSFIATRDEFNSFVDRKDLGICDYVQPAPSQTPADVQDLDLRASIFGEPFIKNGFSRSFEIKFSNAKNEPITDVEYTCNIYSDVHVSCEQSEGIVTLYIDDEDDIGKSFTLQILVNDIVMAEMQIMIVEAF